MRMHSLPSDQEAPMLPFILSTNSFAMDSPSPVDPRAFSTVKKRSNRRFALTSSSADACTFLSGSPLSEHIPFCPLLSDILPKGSRAAYAALSAPSVQI